MASKPRKRVLVGTTGSVAAIKVPELVEQLQKIQDPQAREFTWAQTLDSVWVSTSIFHTQLEVEVVATARATHFFDPAQLSCKCHLDEHEWVIHQDYRKFPILSSYYISYLCI